MPLETPVQHSVPGRRGKAWRQMSGPRPPRAPGEVVLERVTLELPKDAHEFLDLWALYRNARARVLKTRVKVLSRKSLSEDVLIDYVQATRDDLKEMFDALGPFPREEDFADRDELREAMEKYARRVIAWDKKNSDE